MWHRSHVPPIGWCAAIASYVAGLIVLVAREGEALELDIELKLEARLDHMDDVVFGMHGLRPIVALAVCVC